MNLFAWQRAVIAAHDLTLDVRMTAVRIALDSSSTSGLGITINDVRVAEDLGCSTRTVWRRVQDLVEAGWVVQTTKPTYAGRDSASRRAAYQLLIPGNPGPVDCHEPADDVTRLRESSANDAPAMSDDFNQSSDTTPRNLSHDSGKSSDTLTLKSSDTPHGDLARFPTTTITTAAAASSIEVRTAATTGLPPAVEILRGNLEARRLAVRWDKLTPDQLADVERLVDLHGDAVLVKAALQSYRPDSPPQFAQAWLGTWNAIPAPGTRLALVTAKPEICKLHGVTRSPSGVCISCEADDKADRKAGDR